MVRLSKIYTRSGDDGSTGLADGSRRSKADLRLSSYGTVDELNSCIGLAACCVGPDAPDPDAEIARLLRELQHDLFDLGADLATPGTDEGLRMTADRVEAVESAIDRFNSALEPLSSFVLPGGSELASRLHVARTVCRRAEREVVALAATEPLNPQVLPFLNRLGDLLFVLARTGNDGGRADVLWVPGRNRS